LARAARVLPRDRLPGRSPKRARSAESTEEETAPAITVGKAPQQQQLKHKKLRDKADALQAARQQLPVFAGRQGILDAFKSNDTLVIVGETGSGKTTRSSRPRRIFARPICTQKSPSSYWPVLCPVRNPRYALPSHEG
jgi:ABC-type glutathione transport system ATPase component